MMIDLYYGWWWWWHRFNFFWPREKWIHYPLDLLLYSFDLNTSPRGAGMMAEVEQCRTSNRQINWVRIYTVKNDLLTSLKSQNPNLQDSPSFSSFPFSVPSVFVGTMQTSFSARQLEDALRSSEVRAERQGTQLAQAMEGPSCIWHLCMNRVKDRKWSSIGNTRNIKEHKPCNCVEWFLFGNKCNVTRHPGSQVHCAWRVREDWTTLPGSLGSSKYRIEGHLFGTEKKHSHKRCKKTETIRPPIS